MVKARLPLTGLTCGLQTTTTEPLPNFDDRIDEFDTIQYGGWACPFGSTSHGKASTRLYPQTQKSNRAAGFRAGGRHATHNAEQLASRPGKSPPACRPDSTQNHSNAYEHDYYKWIAQRQGTQLRLQTPPIFVTHLLRHFMVCSPLTKHFNGTRTVRTVQLTMIAMDL